MYLVGIYWLSDDAGAQVAIIYSLLDPMWSLDVLGPRNKISVFTDISVLGFYGNIGNIGKYRWIF